MAWVRGGKDAGVAFVMAVWLMALGVERTGADPNGAFIKGIGLFIYISTALILGLIRIQKENQAEGEDQP